MINRYTVENAVVVASLLTEQGFFAHVYSDQESVVCTDAPVAKVQTTERKAFEPIEVAYYTGTWKRQVCKTPASFRKLVDRCIDEGWETRTRKA
jgi:hypothetical protein